MKDSNKIVKATIASILALATTGAIANTTHSVTLNDLEKCYGITKAGMNDCQTSTEQCASSSTKDNQPDAFIFVLKGTCDKIVGGSLTPKTDGTSK